MNRLATPNLLRSLNWLITVVTLGWSLWVVLMLWQPEPFGEPLLRAWARIAIVLCPAVLFVRLLEDRPFLNAVGLIPRSLVGVAYGIMAFAFYPGLLFVYRIWQGAMIVLPIEQAIWINYVIGAPFAEEVLYRGVIYRVLLPFQGRIRSAVISSIAFVLLHLPWWVLSGEKSGADLLFDSFAIFSYGLIFAGLFQQSRSLWAAIVFHLLNNLALLSIHVG